MFGGKSAWHTCPCQSGSSLIVCFWHHPETGRSNYIQLNFCPADYFLRSNTPWVAIPQIYKISSTTHLTASRVASAGSHMARASLTQARWQKERQMLRGAVRCTGARGPVCRGLRLCFGSLQCPCAMCSQRRVRVGEVRWRELRGAPARSGVQH